MVTCQALTTTFSRMAEEPSLARRELGRRLARLRVQAGLTQEDAVVDADISVPTLRRIERGQAAVKTGTVLTLCRTYQVTGDVTEALVALAQETKGKGLWEDSSVVPDWFGLYLGLERTSHGVEIWTTELVAGLFQTEGYARAIIPQMDPRADADTVAHRVRVRMERQSAMLKRTAEGLVTVTAILSAAALTVEVGSGEVMRQQVDHLRSLAEQDGIYVGVVPWRAGPRPALSPFTILSFNDEEDPDIVYLELDTGALYREKRPELETYRMAYARLHEQSVPIREYE